MKPPTGSVETLFTIKVGRYLAQPPMAGHPRVLKKATTDIGYHLPDVEEDLLVVLDPDLPDKGMFDRVGYSSMPRIRLREWNLQVLIHELCHYALDHIVHEGLPVSKHNHALINPIEVALAPILHQLASEDIRLTERLQS